MASFKSSSKPMKTQCVGSFRARPLDVQILAHDGLDFDRFVGAFQSGQIHFATNLQAVRISRPDQSAFLKHGNIKYRTGLKFIHVHVRTVLPGTQRAAAAFGVMNGRPSFFFWLLRIGTDGDRARERSERRE
jgi:hypothetical protein